MERRADWRSRPDKDQHRGLIAALEEGALADFRSDYRMGWALKDRDVMIGDEVDGDIYIEDERKRQAEKEDVRTVAGKRELIRTFLNRVRDELLEIVPNMPEEWDGHELSWLVTEKFAFEQLTAKFACTDDAAWRERVRAFNNERLVRNL